MFICGNDAKAKQVTTGLLKEFGWPVMDIGGIDGSRMLEPLALLWITMGSARALGIMPSNCYAPSPFLGLVSSNLTL